jgi:hypothetical protein
MRYANQPEEIRMKILCNRLIKLLFTASLCVLLIACSKITQENFDKIKNNMSMKEVTAILGEPTSAESITIAGISGTSAVWKDSNAEIDIQLLNNRVTVKAFSKEGDQDSHQTNAEQPYSYKKK